MNPVTDPLGRGPVTLRHVGDVENLRQVRRSPIARLLTIGPGRGRSTAPRPDDGGAIRQCLRTLHRVSSRPQTFHDAQPHLSSCPGPPAVYRPHKRAERFHCVQNRGLLTTAQARLRVSNSTIARKQATVRVRRTSERGLVRAPSATRDSQHSCHVSYCNPQSAHSDERKYAARSHGPSLFDQLAGLSHATAEKILGESEDSA